MRTLTPTILLVALSVQGAKGQSNEKAMFSLGKHMPLGSETSFAPPAKASRSLLTTSDNDSCDSEPTECACKFSHVDYRGSVATTKSGVDCLFWAATDYFKPDMYPDAALEENYCRNPDNEPGGAWCVIPKFPFFEKCEIPKCPNKPTISPRPSTSLTSRPSLSPTTTAEPSSTQSPMQSSQKPSLSMSPSNDPTVSAEPSSTFAPSTEQNIWWSEEPLEEIYSGLGGLVAAVSLSSDSKQVVLAQNMYFALVKIENTSDITVFEGHVQQINSVDFNPDGTQIATAALDSTVRVWNVTNNNATVADFRDHQEGALTVAFSPDGQTLASGSYDKTVKWWTTEDMFTPKLTLLHNTTVYTVCFHPDGNILASAGGEQSTAGFIKIWDLSKGELLKTLFGHDVPVQSVAFSPDGTKLVSGSQDRTHKIWNWKTGRIIDSFNSHSSWVNSVRFTEDGQYVISGSDDGTVHVTDLAKKSFVSLQAHADVVSSVDTNPEGTIIVSGSWDQTVLVWSQQCGLGLYGTFPDCKPCELGTAKSRGEDPECTECPAGSYQDEEGQTACKFCSAGTFQPLRGQTSCEECQTGGYCPEDYEASDSCDGGFISCPKGTANGVLGQSEDSSCVQCPASTFSDGMFMNEKCVNCPFRLGSKAGSDVCDFCDDGFYLNSKSEVAADELQNRPTEYCVPCPVNAVCEANTTLLSLKGEEGFWRDSDLTETFYKCDGDVDGSICRGDSCAEGHGGPLCQVCTDESYAYNNLKFKCTKCPPLSRLGSLFGIAIGLLLLIWILYNLADYSPKTQHIIFRLSTLSASTRVQTKFKILISFYQIVVNFESIYGVKMHSAFTSWFNLMSLFNFDFNLFFGVPERCLGSMETRLLIHALWPVGLILLFVGGNAVYTFILEIRGKSSSVTRSKAWSRSVYFAIFVVYLVLPSVCAKIFSAIKCRSFITDTTTDDSESISYLVADFRLKCDGGDSDYKTVRQTFWGLFFLWPVVVPTATLAVLMQVRKYLRSRSFSPLSEASRFLWADYNEGLMFWEVFDLTRKIFLTGLIMFIDTEEGSNRVLRLIVSAMVCVIFGIFMTRMQPYKSRNDMDLALLSNMLLTGCFLVGIVIHQCEEDEDLIVGENICMKLFGIANSYKATLAAVIMTATMVVMFVVILVILAKQELDAATVKLVSTNSAPNMIMSKEEDFHMFVSHVWKTGQDKAHNFVRILKLYFQGIHIWLDVDFLENVGGLEESVGKSTNFVLFYTQGYFKSFNCRREVIEAVKQGKPTTVVYSGDDKTIDVLKEECRMSLTEDEDPEKILAHILTEKPILWLGGSSLPFAMASIKVVGLPLLRCLPYYQKNPRELEKGLKTGNEINISKLSYPGKILYCSENEGVLGVVKDMESIIGDNVEFIDTTEDDVVLRYRDVDVKNTANNDVMLLYLNEDSFKDHKGRLKEVVALLYDENVKIVMVHEQDVGKGQCTFDQIIRQTPNDLIARGLYNDIAIPLYTRAEYRDVSLNLMLKKMSDNSSS